MALLMVSLKRSKSGRWSARKGIPADVREEYSRLYGQQREALFSAAKESSHAEAKVLLAEWVAQVETRIDAIRKRARGQGLPLTRKEALGLAGEWYQWFVGKHQEHAENSERVGLGWSVEEGSFLDDLEELAPRWFREKLGRTDDDWQRWINEPSVRPDARAITADYAHTAQFLADKGLTLTQAACDLFLDCVEEEFIAATRRLQRLSDGDFTPDPRPQRFPPFALPGRKATKSATAMDLFTAWVEGTGPRSSTVTRYRCVFEDLQAKYPEGVGGITEDEARAWANGLIDPSVPRSAGVVRNNWVRPARSVFGWGVDQKIISDNPFERIKIKVRKRPRDREGRAFEEAEQATILYAAYADTDAKSYLGAARRWVHWLMAYTGARCGEITQLRKEDIVQRDGIQVIELSPQAGTVKTGQGRTVPLHEHIIEQGFLDFVRSRRDGPLFYNPRNDATPDDPTKPKRARSVTLVNRLATWVRALGVTDKEIQPNHAWRHTFKARALRFGMREHIVDAICGHAPASVGRSYSTPTLADKAAELRKFPRYEFDKRRAGGEARCFAGRS
jgi:integrase